MAKRNESTRTETLTRRMKRRTPRTVMHKRILKCTKSEVTPAPQTKAEAMAQIRDLVRDNKASLDALSKL